MLKDDDGNDDDDDDGDDDSRKRQHLVPRHDPPTRVLNSVHTANNMQATTHQTHQAHKVKTHDYSEHSTQREQTTYSANYSFNRQAPRIFTLGGKRSIKLKRVAED